MAQEAMRQLLRDGLVQLYFGRMEINEVSPLPSDVALRVIDDPRAWEIEQLYPNAYCFLNTDAGDGAYRMRFDRNSE